MDVIRPMRVLPTQSASKPPVQITPAPAPKASRSTKVADALVSLTRFYTTFHIQALIHSNQDDFEIESFLLIIVKHLILKIANSVNCFLQT